MRVDLEAWRRRGLARDLARVHVPRVARPRRRGHRRAGRLYLAKGTRFAFPPGSFPFDGEHPWAARGAWQGHGLLVTHCFRDAFAIWHFWDGPKRAFAGWYVNFQAPFRRDGMAFETQDYELDLWITPAGVWRWKDEDALLDWVHRGRFTESEVAAISAEGERVLAAWPFPTGWEAWEPDPSWCAPVLAPEGR